MNGHPNRTKARNHARAAYAPTRKLMTQVLTDYTALAAELHKRDSRALAAEGCPESGAPPLSASMKVLWRNSRTDCGTPLSEGQRNFTLAQQTANFEKTPSRWTSKLCAREAKALIVSNDFGRSSCPSLPKRKLANKSRQHIRPNSCRPEEWRARQLSESILWMAARA